MKDKDSRSVGMVRDSRGVAEAAGGGSCEEPGARTRKILSQELEEFRRVTRVGKLRVRTPRVQQPHQELLFLQV
jgi:hypothetical protein